MKAETTFSILFWIKKSRLSKGKVPIYARLTINGKRIEISIQREVSIVEWDSRSQMSIGRSIEAKTLNSDLTLIKAKLLSCHSKLSGRGEPVTAEALKNEYTGVVEKPRMLLEIIQQHNNDIEKLIGIDYSRITWTKYNTMLKHVKSFIRWKFKG